MSGRGFLWSWLMRRHRQDRGLPTSTRSERLAWWLYRACSQADLRGRRDRAHPDAGSAQAQRSPVRHRPRARTPSRRSTRPEMVAVAQAVQNPGDHEGLATPGLAARLRRSACVRRPLPQDQVVPEGLQAAPAKIPAACPADRPPARGHAQLSLDEPAWVRSVSAAARCSPPDAAIAYSARLTGARRELSTERRSPVSAWLR